MQPAPSPYGSAKRAWLSIRSNLCSYSKITLLELHQRRHGGSILGLSGSLLRWVRYLQLSRPLPFTGEICSKAATSTGVYQERLTTEILYLNAMELLAARYHDDCRFNDAIGMLLTVISIDPLRETARRLLMQAYAADGKLSNAVLAYREFRELVRRELKSVPDAETTGLYQRIRDSVDERSQQSPEGPLLTDIARGTSTPGRLPRPLSYELIGRTVEITELTSTLGKSRLITLVGAGGIGKTRLAIQVAGTALDQFNDGAWFADLSGTRSSEMLAPFVVSCLEIPEDVAESSRDQLAQHLKTKEIP